MEDFFIIDKDRDGSITIKLKTEANVILASVEKEHGYESDQFSSTVQSFHGIIDIVELLDRYNTPDFNTLDKLKTIIKLVEVGPLSPLTLKDDEFIVDDTNDIATVYENKRFRYLDRYDNNVDNTKKYVNHRAFIIDIKSAYSHLIHKQLNDIPNHSHLFSPRVYITKGGVVTGEYIYLCYILEQDIINKRFDKFLPVILPVSIIFDHTDYIYTIDSRDPNIALLRMWYDVLIIFDEEVKGKYDIRKYKKLNK